MINRIKGSSSPRVQVKARRKSLKTGSFKLEPMVEPSTNSCHRIAIESVNNLATLLNLQGAKSADQGVSQAEKLIDDGFIVLDSLKALQLELLGGTATADQLSALSKSLETLTSCPAVPPNLVEIIEEVSLRAKVELAKLGIF